MEEDTESTPGATNLLPHQASRTVLILGKIGVGKSTIANQIFGRVVFPVRPSMEAMTRTSKELLCQNCIVPLSDTEMNVTIKIVDTTGQFATTQYAARDLISACNGQVHLICFVTQNGVIITDAEKRAMKDIIRILNHHIDDHRLQHVLALIITNCEGLDKKARDGVIKDFKLGKDTEGIAAAMHNRIYTVGFPNTDKVIPALKDAYKEEIANDRKKLHELIIQSNSPISLNRPPYKRSMSLSIPKTDAATLYNETEHYQQQPRPTGMSVVAQLLEELKNGNCQLL